MIELYIGLQALNFLWLAGLTVAGWARKPGLEAGAQIDKIEDAFGKALEAHRADTQRELRVHELQLARIESHMRHMPSSGVVETLAGTVKTIDERTHGMADGMSVLRTAVNRIESYLLNTKG